MTPAPIPILPQGSPDQDAHHHRSTQDLNDHQTSTIAGRKRKPRAPVVPEAKWDALKAAISEVYHSPDGSLAKVMAVMEEQHGFSAT